MIRSSIPLFKIVYLFKFVDSELFMGGTSDCFEIPRFSGFPNWFYRKYNWAYRCQASHIYNKIYVYPLDSLAKSSSSYSAIPTSYVSRISLYSRDVEAVVFGFFFFNLLYCVYPIRSSLFWFRYVAKRSPSFL